MLRNPKNGHVFYYMNTSKCQNNEHETKQNDYEPSPSIRLKI